MTALIGNPLLLTSAPADDDAYQIEKSLRFNSADTPYLSRTPRIGNQRTWTWSGWIKRTQIGLGCNIFGANSAASDTGYLSIHFGSDDTITSSGNNTIWRVTTAKFRDPSAWYHLVFVADTSNAIADERFRWYCNGKRITSFSTNNAITQNNAIGINTAGIHTMSRYPTSGGHAGYISTDVQFIDGLALSPAAFGSFDSKGVWNPKAFALPAPNDNTTWSSGTITNEHSTYPVSKAFDGNIGSGNDYWGPADGTASFNGFASFVPSNDIEFTTSLRIFADFDTRPATAAEPYILVTTDIGGEQRINGPIGGNVYPEQANMKWYPVIEGKGKLTQIKLFQSALGYWGRVHAIEVDGVILVDGQTDPTTRNNVNNGTVWNDYVSNAAANDMFNGSSVGGTWAAAGTPVTFDFTSIGGLTYKEIIRAKIAMYGSSNTLEINGTDVTSNLTAEKNKWYDISSWFSGKTLNTAEWGLTGGSDYISWENLEIDGNMIVSGTTDNSFHLKFNDTSLNRYLGKDTLTGALADATGAKPILTTTDAYGDVTAGAVDTSDSNKSNLVFAWPGNSTTNEVHHTVKGSGSAKTVTANGDPSVDTDNSRLYGTSVAFDRTADYLSVDGGSDFNFGTGDYTIECWFMTTDNSVNQGIFVISDTSGGLATDESAHISAMIGNNLQVRPGDGTTKAIIDGKPANNAWHHLAISRASGTFRAFYDGGLMYTKTGVTTSHADQYLAIGGYYSTSYLWKGNIQDFRIYKGTAKYTASFTAPNRNDFTVTNLSAEGGKITVDNATAALPIYNTTGDQGGTKGVGNRTDPKSSYLKLAFAGDSLDDESGNSHDGTNAGGLTVGSTDKSRFYGSSFKFPNSLTGHLSISDHNDFNFGTSSFCVEGWMYISGGGQWNPVYTIGVDAGESQSGFKIEVLTSNKLRVYGMIGSAGSETYSQIIVSDNALTLQKWLHFAVVRNGNLFDMYIDGQKACSQVTNTGNIKDPTIGSKIGRDNSTENLNRTFNGYMNDIRVYIGDPKYTDTFSPPTEGNPETIDSFTDSPTSYGDDNGLGGEVRGNYCTMNPLHGAAGVNTGTRDLSEGNLTYKHTKVDGYWRQLCTMAAPAGKWYWEFTCNDLQVPEDQYIGLVKDTHDPWSYLTEYIGFKPDGWSINQSGNTAHNGSFDVQGVIPAMAKGDVIQIAVDNSAGKLWFGKNGTWGTVSSNTGNPAAGTYPTHTNVTGPIIPATSFYKNNTGGHLNFGQRAFKYTAPTGFKCICTQNLPDLFSEDELNDPSKFFDVKTWTGTGSAGRDIKGFNFGPDFVWIKNTNGTSWHKAFDQIRGVGKPLHQNESNAEATEATTLTAFNSDGFELGTSGTVNDFTGTYIGYGWDAGTDEVTPSTAGSINPTDEWVNATAGFSIIRFTSPDDSSAQTVGHSLNAVPHFIISKNLENTYGWEVWHKDLAAGKSLNLDGVGAVSAGRWGSMTDTTFGTVSSYTHYSTHKYINYLWTEIPGYSKFGSYIGATSTAEANNEFIYCGFQPKFVLIKNSTQSNTYTGWLMQDSGTSLVVPAGGTYANNANATGKRGDGAAASGDQASIDILSNGFLCHSENAYETDSVGETFIYAAWAEYPFKISRAH